MSFIQHIAKNNLNRLRMAFRRSNGRCGIKMMGPIRFCRFSFYTLHNPFCYINIKISLCFFVLLLMPAMAQESEDGIVKYVTFDDKNDKNSIKEGKKSTGQVGFALDLDGINDYVDLDDLSIMEDYSFAVSFWYKSKSGRGWIFSEGNSSSNVPICGLKVGRFIGMMCRSTANPSMKRQKTIKREINDDEWHHIALIGNGSQMTLYIDAIYSGSMDLPEIKPALNMTSLGRLGRRNSMGYVKAEVDELRLYDRELSDSEILELATIKDAEPSVALNPSGDSIAEKEPILAMPASFELPKVDLQMFFGRAPVKGVYPRILFGPEELPAIRWRLRNTGSGKAAYERLTRMANKLRSGELAAFYIALTRGDKRALEYIGNCFWRDKARMILSYEAYILLIEDVTGTRADQFASALTTFAEITGGFYKENVCNWSGKDHFALADLAYAYDFAYQKLSEQQRRRIRSAVSRKLSGKFGYGMDMHKNDRVAPPNYQMHGMSYYILNLAFEGEAGFSSSLNTKAEALAWDFVEREIHSDGTPREGMHYFNFGMEHGAEALIAMSRRGRDIINHQNYRRMLNWYIYSVEPYGYKFSTHGDTIRQGGGLMDNYTLLKYVWPKNIPLDYAWRHRMGDKYEKFNQLHDYLLPAIFGADLLEESKSPTSANLPLAFHSRDRGFSVARSSWDTEALSLRFSSRSDLHTTGHYHSDHNDFTLTARGKDWVKDWGYHSYRDFQHNLVQIDGLGQGYFPSAGEFPKFIHNELITVSVGDAKYAYTYRWIHNSRRGASGYRSYSWEIEPGVDQTGRTNTTWRSKWNPVEKAFRTVSLVRGDNPYVLIVDDIKKDNKNRVYDWLLQMLETNKVISHRDDQLILAQGDERLLVRLLYTNGPTRSSFEDFRVDRMVDNGGVDRIHADIGTKKRLIFSTKSTEPGFKVLLYPHRAGMSLPTTLATKSGDRIQIKFSGQNDIFEFYDIGGRSAFAFERDGELVVKTD